MSKPNAKTRKMVKALAELGRIAEIMIDGEEALKVISDRSCHYIANPDPKFRFAVGDFYDVDFDGFLQAKKTLLRLSKLVAFPCDGSLWVNVKGMENHVTLMVHNGKLGRLYTFGQKSMPVEGDLAKCMDAGEIVVLEPSDEKPLVTVLAPVRDSLGDIVGAAEFNAQDPTSKTLAPAWS